MATTILRVSTCLFQDDNEHHMPLFAVVCTKFKRDGVAANETMLELAVNSETLERVKTVDDALEAIKSAQARIESCSARIFGRSE